MDTSYAISEIQRLFASSLCRDDFGLDSTGYLTPCTVNTYLLVLPQILIFLYILSQAKADLVQTTPQRTLLKKLKLLFTALHVVVIMRYGPSVLNALSTSVGLFMLMVTFIMTYMDLNGVEVPSFALEAYYHIWTAATGYLSLSLVAHQMDAARNIRLAASTAICCVSLMNSALRNISNAAESNTTPSL